MFRLRMTGLVFLAILPLWIETANATDIEKNKTLVRSFVDATNELDYSALDEILATDVVRHSQSTPDLKITNRADFKAYLAQDAATFDGARVDVEILIAEGDRIAILGVFNGTHVQPVGPIKATGKPVSITISGMFRIKDDRIVEFWVLWDNMALLTQLGHPPFSPTVGE